MTSSFDIVGPFFTSPGTIESKFVCACVMESRLNYSRYETVLIFYFTAVSFKVNGFKTSIMICDGASANLSMIKASHGCHGM